MEWSATFINYYLLGVLPKVEEMLETGNMVDGLLACLTFCYGLLASVLLTYDLGNMPRHFSDNLYTVSCLREAQSYFPGS